MCHVPIQSNFYVLWRVHIHLFREFLFVQWHGIAVVNRYFLLQIVKESVAVPHCCKKLTLCQRPLLTQQALSEFRVFRSVEFCIRESVIIVFQLR